MRFVNEEKRLLLRMLNDTNTNSFLILYECIKNPMNKNKIYSKSSKNRYHSPPDLENEIDNRINRLKQKSKKQRFEFFDDHIARLDDWHSDKNGLHLKFSKTTYFQFAALNAEIDKRLVVADKKRTVREYLKEKPSDIKGSKLPNPLSVSVSVVLKPESKIVISKRSSKNFEASNVLSNLIGGTISIGSRDVDKTGNPDPFKTIIREMWEELNLKKINYNDIIIFGLGRNLSNLKPELFGEIQLDMNKKEITEIWKSSTDKWETSQLKFMEMNPNAMMKILNDEKWSPVGRICTISSLLTRM